MTPAATTSLSPPDLVPGADVLGSPSEGDGYGDGDACWQSPGAFGGGFGDDDDDRLFGGERDFSTADMTRDIMHDEQGFGADAYRFADAEPVAAQARTPSHEVAAIEAAKRELLQYESQPFTWLEESDEDGSAFHTTTE